jgi:hypothetical protein
VNSLLHIFMLADFSIQSSMRISSLKSVTET